MHSVGLGEDLKTTIHVHLRLGVDFLSYYVVHLGPGGTTSKVLLN